MCCSQFSSKRFGTFDNLVQLDPEDSVCTAPHFHFRKVSRHVLGLSGLGDMVSFSTANVTLCGVVWWRGITPQQSTSPPPAFPWFLFINRGISVSISVPIPASGCLCPGVILWIRLVSYLLVFIHKTYTQCSFIGISLHWWHWLVNGSWNTDMHIKTVLRCSIL